MELIANLKNTKANEGLTPENLSKLENIFRQAVGENQEINLDSFKKMIQSKNPFFTERIFRVLDVDQSGTVSLEEFMRAMRAFAQNTLEVKLRYLFDVYDMSGDGLIQLEELRAVLRECLKENGLQFENAELSELALMLFEDADKDHSGGISFEEFRNQIAIQPGLMENIVQSIEQWLIPPMETPDNLFPDYRPRWLKKVNWRHIRNNWTSVLFLLAFFVTNVMLFVTRAIEFCDHNMYVIIARACGQCLNFNSAFIVLLVLRQTLTWLRTNGFSQYLPIDHHIYYHQLTGCLVLLYGLVHTACHIANFNIMAEEKGISVFELMTSTHFGIGWAGGSACITGWILLAVLIAMSVTAMPTFRRSGKFEVFYCTHLLCFVFWICLIVHGPNFWKWFVGPAILYFFECVIRFSRNFTISKLAYVQQGVLLPSKVTHLVIKRPPNFQYKPGDYVYINIPSIARFEWHPFTISSAPEFEDVLWLHIRGVGTWTNSLHEYFQKEDEEAVLSDELAARPIETLPEHIRKKVIGLMYSNDDQKKPSNLGRSNPRRSPKTSTTTYDIPSRSPKTSTTTYDIPARSPKVSTSTYVLPVMSPLQVTGSLQKNGSVGSAFRNALDDSFNVPSPNSSNITVIEMTQPGTGNSNHGFNDWRNRTSLSLKKSRREDKHAIVSRRHSSLTTGSFLSDISVNVSSRSHRNNKRDKRPSVRVSVAKRGLRQCQTVILMPTVEEEEEEESGVKDSNVETESVPEVKIRPDVKMEENVIVRQRPLKIFLDGPYGSPTRHLFQSRHAVLIATGIGVTPFASILQSIMCQYRKSRHSCPNCQHKWTDSPVLTNRLRKVDFFWLNRHQRAFEWFVSLLSELEAEQAQSTDRFLDIHMYITSALKRTDMKAVGLQMALDLLYQKESRDLITGLKSRTQPGRPDWDKVFTSIAQQQKGKVTVFFCGPQQLAKTLQSKCDEFGFRFRKEIF